LVHSLLFLSATNYDWGNNSSKYTSLIAIQTMYSEFLICSWKLATKGEKFVHLELDSRRKIRIAVIK
jgi:hypothetical protein